MKFDKHDIKRNRCMLTGSFKRKGYDWWWHSFTAKNAVTGEEKPFFIEFFLCNPKLAKDTPTLGQLPENKKNGVKPSYLMVKAGCWGEGKKQLHRFFSWKDIKVNYGVPFEITADDCYASETRLKGRIKVTDAAKHPEYMCDDGEIQFDLKVKKLIPFNVGYGAGGFFRAIKAFEMYWHAEGMKSEYEGEIVMDGERYIVSPEGSFGYADKNWGRGFTSPWVWLSSNNLVSNLTGKKLQNSVFDIGGGRPKVFCFALNRKLLGAFYYESECYEFNFSKFWTGTKTEFTCTETDTEILWRVKQQNRRAVMVTEIRCNKKDMLLVNYEAPNGEKRHNRLWNGGNGTGNIKLYKKLKKGKTELLDDISVYNVGCEYGEYDR